jgi:hypothetical protein
MSLELLRGRVLVAPYNPQKIGSIVLPDMSRDWQANAERAEGIKAKSSHFGTVRAFGPPAIIYGKHEIPRLFDVGDLVVFVWSHNEKVYTGEWDPDAGERTCWIGQEHVIAVIEGRKVS